MKLDKARSKQVKDTIPMFRIAARNLFTVVESETHLWQHVVDSEAEQAVHDAAVVAAAIYLLEMIPDDSWGIDRSKEARELLLANMAETFDGPALARALEAASELMADARLSPPAALGGIAMEYLAATESGKRLDEDFYSGPLPEIIGKSIIRWADGWWT